MEIEKSHSTANCISRAIQIRWRSDFRNSSAIFRSSHWRCPKQKSVKNFAIFSGKQQWKSFYFNNVVDLQVCNFLKKVFNAGVFPVKFEKFFRTPFLQNTCGCYLYFCWNIMTQRNRSNYEIQWKCFLIMKYHSEKLNKANKFEKRNSYAFWLVNAPRNFLRACHTQQYSQNIQNYCI